MSEKMAISRYGVLKEIGFHLYCVERQLAKTDEEREILRRAQETLEAIAKRLPTVAKKGQVPA